MNFPNAIKAVYTKYASFEGRASRSEYWYFQLFFFGVIGILIFALGEKSSLVILPFELGSMVPAIAVNCRRLHDCDRSGWWYLLVFTAVGAFVLLYWIIFRGTVGANRFGPDPYFESEAIHPKSPTTSPPLDYDKLERIAQLRDNGVLSEAEFDEQKALLLGRPSA